MTLPANTDVLIIGGGPAGLTLANLLGTEGIDTVLVERNPGTVPEPRAIALDGESLRTLQATGLADVILPTIKQGFVADYRNGEGRLLFTTDLTPRPYGFCLQNSFDQPTLERQLLAGLARFDCVSVCHNATLQSFEQDGEGVEATVLDGDGALRRIRAGYLAGCDGGRSGVRQQLAIAMEGDRLPQKWLVIDTIDPVLTGEPECRFFCDPARPAMTMLRPGDERRWEWMLVGDEADEDMLDDARIRALLQPHTDPAQVEVYRKCVYGFSAVVASRFSQGRVFLAGDAAHMTPPFAGQGLNAGIRDVRNLSWKLARVIRGALPARLLDSYDTERRDAARELVDLAVMLGDQIQPADPVAAAERDANFEAMNADPGAAAAFGRELVAPLLDVRLAGGWLGSDALAGRMLPQPTLQTEQGPVLLDDLLGEGFTALLAPGVEVPDAVTAHPLWRALDPALRPLPAALADFAEESPILLVRPDRFVLAGLDPAGDAGRVLDDLRAAL